MTENTLIEDDNNMPPETPEPEAAVEPKKAVASKKAATVKNGEVISAAKRVRIVLEEGDNIPPTGLFVGVNGRSFMIRPGEEVEVPVEVLEALNDAVEATPKTDTQGNVVTYRDRLRFPYRVVSR